MKEKEITNIEQEKIDSIISKQARLEYKLDFIFEILQEIKQGLERKEREKRLIEAKNQKKDAERCIRDVEASSHYDYERRQEERQRYNGYFALESQE